MSKCPFCGGAVEKKALTYPQEYEGTIVILENVEVEVCVQCGEVLLAPETVERVQQLVWSHAKPTRKTSVPVYDLAGAN